MKRGPIAPAMKREMYAFLKCFDSPFRAAPTALGHSVLPGATPAQSAARQECQARGLANFVNGEWRITERGRTALNYWKQGN